MRDISEYSTIKLESIVDKTIVTGIVKKIEKNTLIIRANEKIEFKLEEEVLIHIFDKDKGIFIYNGFVSSILEKIITITNFTFLFDKQRRDKHRIVVNIPIEISKISNGSKKTIELIRPIYIIARNISARGILLECELDIPKKISFSIELPIDNEKIYLRTITKRKYQKDGLYYYGCMFVLQDNAKLYMLERFIMKNYNNKFFKYY